MTLAEYIKTNISEAFATIPLSACAVTKPYLIADAPKGTELYAVVMAAPYPRNDAPPLASFARIPDYHGFFAHHGGKIASLLLEKYGGAYVKTFADHSPIDERRAALDAGLGIIGDNGYLITEKYGSFVFIGETVCSLTRDELSYEGIPHGAPKEGGCLHCGACRDACPSGALRGNHTLCVAGLTQKKGLLSDTERAIIKASGYAWGCDVCASVCPMNEGVAAKYSDHFTAGAIDGDERRRIGAMSDGEYAKYPFSWRKREIIMRNFDIIEGAEEVND
ncbi:MAG: epoxyqueuosine reductase [Clostridia bacterium]|nr:epoxyqueuosine reductase [Clostridia bacterium]